MTTMNVSDYIMPFFFPILAVIVALIHIRWKQFHGVKALETFLVWQLSIGFGLVMLSAGLSHLIFPDEVALSI
ncbi:MAG: hypothetical protein PHF57_12610, partial [Methanoregula sp.]|nr:hypothetical protein [Methanoregula sp.]